MANSWLENLYEESRKSAEKKHSFGFKDVTKIGIGLVFGVASWNIAQNIDSVRPIFNLPAEFLAKFLNKITGIEEKSLGLGIRELYDVLLFSPLIVLASVIWEKLAAPKESWLTPLHN